VPKIGATDKSLLLVARLFAIPMTGLACMVAALAYNPGYLLVVAFDVVLAGCFVPLMAAVYWPSMTPNAGVWPWSQAGSLWMSFCDCPFWMCHTDWVLLGLLEWMCHHTGPR
jgi:Na+(H+)/acetate symporter ActP